MPNRLMYNGLMDQNVRYCIRFKHFLALAACQLLGLYALLNAGSPFGLFAQLFVPPVYLLLLVGIWRGWFDASWC